MELWIPITILAAFSQNLRSALQKHLKSRLSTAGATYVRFFYAVPFALIYLAILNQIFDLKMPDPNAEFIFFGMSRSLIFGHKKRQFGTLLEHLLTFFLTNICFRCIIF